MYLLEYLVVPTKSHPREAELGEGLVSCWIEAGDPEEADRMARAGIEEAHWQILERDACEVTTQDDYEDDDEAREYYQQALTDKEVFVFNVSPKHPVFWVVAEVTQDDPPGEAEAHYFLVSDAIAEEDDDVFALDFWNEARQQLAREWAQKALEEEGWSVSNFLTQRSCGRDDVPEDLLDAYDEAEESDSCLVLFIEDEPEA